MHVRKENIPLMEKILISPWKILDRGFLDLWKKKLRRIYHGLNLTGFYWLLYSIALRTLLPLPLDLTV